MNQALVDKETNMAQCEWNPTLQEPSQKPRRATDCRNDAEVVLGTKGQWHLCRPCAALSKFKRYKVRQNLPTKPIDPR